LVESLFYSWRITHDVRSRQAAWKIFLAIEKYCHTEGGYTTVHDTSDSTVVFEDLQDSFFLSETLKYLYLIFEEDDVFDLKEYVFTTQAHPLKRLI
jgi:mannosyl-oligosaccharide alpha-1,2-mannosidase